MTASGPVTNSAEAKLGHELAKLQASASMVADKIRTTNEAFYRHLAELYLWWREASAVDGYLEAEYSKTGKRLKTKVKYGINFAPLFWLTWGHYNGLSDDKCRRWSIVLNILHSLYESERQYRTDSVAKLANYISNNGGVDGLVNEGNVPDDDAADDDIDDDDADAVSVAPRRNVDELVAQLYDAASGFYRDLAAPPTVDLAATLPTTGDGMSVLVVRKAGDRYQLIGASNDDTLIQPLVMRSYLNDFAALPPSVRCLIELVSTQCLPQRLQPMYESLVDVASTSKARRAVRRVLYQHDIGEFVLSPIRAKSGVVTIAAPAHEVFDNATCDVFLSTRGRRALEQRLISGRDFNLFEALRNDAIPEARMVGLASHVMRLQNRYTSSDYLHLDFWPYRLEANVPPEQLALAGDAKDKCVWRASLPLAWFRGFALEFTLPWIQDHGTYIKRSQERVLQVRFGLSSIMLRFVHRDGQFENECELAVAQGATTDSAEVSVMFLTKDFIVVMQAVADMGVVTQVETAVGNDVMILGFSTGAAMYKIAIPTCTLAGSRSSAAFLTTSAQPVVEDEFETFSEQAEGDFDEGK
jgi:hypothetical protein